MENGKRRRPHLFRIVLSHSRKGYSEVVWRQTTENFIRCLENAFRYFGGVPKTLVIDNLRAAVTRADWFDPELNAKVAEFCQHYGTVILPTRPAMPRHKSGIEQVLKTNVAGRVRTPVERREQLLAEFERSGLSGSKFATLVGVKHSTFFGWVIRRRKQAGSASVPVKAVDSVR
jgi:transposase